MYILFKKVLYFNMISSVCNCAIDVLDPLSTQVSHSANPTEGKSMTMTCDITDGRPTTITQMTWKKGNTTLHNSNHYQLSDKVLTISSLDHSLDDGHYSCAAKNDAGMGHFSSTFHLLVNCKCALILCET